jgi:peptidoglycan/LPS O-acetylase OafA/YrhL
MKDSRRLLMVFALILLVGGAGFRIAAFIHVYQPKTGSYLSYLPPLRMWGFGLGVLVAAVEPTPQVTDRLSPWKSVLIVLGFIGFIYALVVSVEEYSPRAFFFQWALIPVAGGLAIWSTPFVDTHLLFYLSEARRRKSGWVVASTLLNGLRLVGLASYSIYLWHCLVISAFVHFQLAGMWWSCWVMAVLSLAMGLLSWHLIECRFYRFSAETCRLLIDNGDCSSPESSVRSVQKRSARG